VHWARGVFGELGEAIFWNFQMSWEAPVQLFITMKQQLQFVKRPKMRDAQFRAGWCFEPDSSPGQKVGS
jgi:hypothetical protein